MSYNADNPFAKILRGELPCHKVYETEHCLAFMDLMPQAAGHTLVIPKAAGSDIFEVPEAALRETIVATRKVATAVKVATGAQGIMIAQLNGAAAGQTVFHLHFHILPRNDGLEFKLHARELEQPEVLADWATRIRAELL